eukprot:scaffold67990_cov31-Tisochrysis_lutea.AAC.1
MRWSRVRCRTTSRPFRLPFRRPPRRRRGRPQALPSCVHVACAAPPYSCTWAEVALPPSSAPLPMPSLPLLDPVGRCRALVLSCPDPLYSPSRCD